MEDIKELMALHKTCFNDSDAYISFFFGVRYKKEHSFIKKLDNKVACVVYARMIELSIGEKKLDIPFFTGIATHPDYRYKGLAKQLIAEAITHYKNNNVPFIMLHPFKVSFYENLGFAPINFFKEIEIEYNNKGTAIPSADYSTEELLHHITRQYNAAVSGQFAYLVRDESYMTEMLYEHCIDGGSGAILCDKGNPKGYLLSFAENLREVVSCDMDIINNIPELHGLKAKVMDCDGEPYSMAHVANINSFLMNVPYNNITANVNFAVNNECFELSITNGKLHSLSPSIVNINTIHMSTSQFTGICLGCGYRYDDDSLSAFKALFPKYNIFAYEQY